MLSSPYPFLKPFLSLFTPPANFLCPLPCQGKPLVTCSVAQRDQRKRTTCSLRPPSFHLGEMCLLNWDKAMGLGLQLVQPDLSPCGQSPGCPSARRYQPNTCVLKASVLSLLLPCCFSCSTHNLNSGSEAKGARALLEPRFTSPCNLLTLAGTLQAKCLGVPHPRTRH